MALDQATKQHLEKEMLPFLHKNARADLKATALRYFLDLTGSKDGRDFIAQGDKFLPVLQELTLDPVPEIAQDAYCCLINLSTEDTVAWKLMNIPKGSTFIFDLLKRVLKPDCPFADEASGVVANVTRLPGCASTLAHQILAADSKVTLEGVVQVLCQVKFNKNAQLHYIAPILANLTQISDIRKVVMDKQRCIIQKLLPFTEFKPSSMRRGGILGALKNCCFEYDYHSWLLGEEVDILPRLLLPLAGGEEFDEDDMEKLPLDLQYLPPDKIREQEPDLRIQLIEAVTQLCCTKQGRMYIKAKNTYIIMRELDKWEKEPKVKLVLRNLIDTLIADEPQEGMEDLHKVEVPEELVEKFEKMDADLLKDFQEDLQEEIVAKTQEQQENKGAPTEEVEKQR